MPPSEKTVSLPRPEAEPAVATVAAATVQDGLLMPSQLIADMAGRFGAELLRFATHRMQRHVSYYSGLAQCRSMQEVLDQQLEFVRQAHEDYTAEFGTMAELAQRSAAPKAD